MSEDSDLSKLSIEELNRMEITKKQLFSNPDFLELANKHNLTLEKSKQPKKTLDELFEICYKNWLNADLTSDLLFGLYFDDTEVSERMINLFLRSKNIKIGKVKRIIRQKVVELAFDIKGVRFDLIIEGSDKIINLEIQTGKKSSLPLRIRFYQAMLDMHLLPKGGGDIYDQLPETYVIFICTDLDPLKKGQLEYVINPYAHIPATDEYVLFDTKSTWIVYNASAYKDFDESHPNYDEELKSFFAFLKNDPMDNKFTDYLYEHYIKTKFNNKKGADFLIISLRDYEIKQESREEAIKEQATEFVLSLIEDDLSNEFIAKHVKLPLEEIERIRQEHYS